MVEWKKLGEVCEIKTGRGITQKDCSEDGQYPVISGGQTPMGMYHQYNRESKTVTISRVGAYAGYVSFINERFYLNDKCFSIIPFDNSVLNNKYLYSVLKGQEEIIQKLQSEGGVPTINTKKVGALSIPIPSLSEQQRIVSILDTFTSSISNLKQQIEERRKQYEYERDLLLDLEGKEGVEWKRLSEICEIKGEYGLSVPSKPFDGVRYIRITDITDDGKLNSDCVSADYNEITKVPLEEGDLLFARTGATVGKTLMYLKEYGKCLYAGYLIRYRVNREVVLPKYVFHFTHSNKYNLWVKSNLVEGAQPNINAQKYNSLEIPIPSLQEQSRIVSILDTFEQSIANLEEQQAMREKQYEYYRNQLLTFEGEEERGKT